VHWCAIFGHIDAGHALQARPESLALFAVAAHGGQPGVRAQEAMGRVVFKGELNEPQALIEEFMARVAESTLEALRAKFRNVAIP